MNHKTSILINRKKKTTKRGIPTTGQNQNRNSTFATTICHYSDDTSKCY